MQHLESIIFDMIFREPNKSVFIMLLWQLWTIGMTPINVLPFQEIVPGFIKCRSWYLICDHMELQVP